MAVNSSSNVSNANYSHRFELTAAPSVGDEVVVTLWGDMGADRTGIGMYNTQGYTELFKLDKIADGVHQYTGTWTVNTDTRTSANTHMMVYQFPSNETSASTINRIIVERTSAAGLMTATNAAIDEYKRTRAEADSAVAESIKKLQTTVGGHTSSLQAIKRVTDGASAEYAVKIDNGGRVSGFGLIGTTNRSDFAVAADKFYIAPPTGTGKGDTPFTVLTTTQTINGLRVPAGTYIKSAYIQDGSITTAKIANASIDNAKIANSSIDNAKIRDGAITTAKIGYAQVDTLQIAGEAVVMPRWQYTDWHDHQQAGIWHNLFSFSMDAKGGSMVLFSVGQPSKWRVGINLMSIKSF